MFFFPLILHFGMSFFFFFCNHKIITKEAFSLCNLNSSDVTILKAASEWFLMDSPNTEQTQILLEKLQLNLYASVTLFFFLHFFLC